MADTESFLAKETEEFRLLYVWLKKAFSPPFYEEVTEDALLLIAHSLVGFKLQGYFSAISIENATIVISSDEIDSDYKIYKQYVQRPFASMHTYVSLKPLPNESQKVRIAILMFGEAKELHSELIEKAKHSDFTECEAIAPKEDELPLLVRLAVKETFQNSHVGRYLRVLSMHKLRVGELLFSFVDKDVLYFEVEIFGWKDIDIQALVKELAAVRDFATEDPFRELFPEDADFRMFLRSVSLFVHELFVHVDPHMYALGNVQEAFCYWPAIARSLYALFCLKCDPYNKNLEEYAPLRAKVLELIDRQDTGKEVSDLRRKTCLRFAVYFIEAVLKTNFFVVQKGATAFRLHGSIVAELKEVFPVEPFGIFYIYSRDFFGFHIRFQDLARGGMRTIIPATEVAQDEAALTFQECYDLALTQEKKNKDIPEGGAKAICFLYPNGVLYRAQRLFIESLLSLVSGQDPRIVDYYGLPEYLYLGPDENMHDSMIEWIAAYSEKIGYLPGGAFISSKPKIGINHKRYGVTSLGVNVCMREVLFYLGIDPEKDHFTVKMSGGPDGDVAGNQILNLGKYFGKTAKLLTLIDVSGVIYDPEGLDLEYLKELFTQTKSIRFYPAEKLSNGGFLLDMKSEKKEAIHIVKILCQRKVGDRLHEEWLSGSEAQEIVRTFVHKTPADVFIPAGGRPGALNQYNVSEFLDQSLKPTARAIIEGANLYLTQEARDFLEQKGTIIIKDSSANKGGVICSSFEVLSSLSLSDTEFLKYKEVIVKEILQKIEEYAREEVRLIIETHRRTKAFCSHISEDISDRINKYSKEIRDYLHPVELLEMPYMSCFFEFCLPLLVQQFPDRLKSAVPDVHKKAIVASWIASKIVYTRGLEWAPSVVDILPFLVQDPSINACPIKPA